MPIFGMSLWLPINLQQVLQLVRAWSDAYWQLLTVCTAIGLRSVETSLRIVGEWLVTGCNWDVTGRWLTVDWFAIKTNAYKKDVFHNRTISLQVFKMLTTGQLQLLCLQRVKQNAAIVAEKVKAVVVETLDSKKVSFFHECLHTIFNSRSDLIEHLLGDDAVMCRQVSDVCKPIAEWLTHAWKSLCNWSPIDHRLIADHSQIGRCHIAKIHALFMV